MPVHPCHHGFCAEFVARRGDYCTQHAEQGRQKRAEQQQRYDRARDPRAVQFYHSAAWLRVRQHVLERFPVCQKCNRAWSKHVHHHKPLKEFWELRLDPENLKAVCRPCHDEIESEAARSSR